MSHQNTLQSMMQLAKLIPIFLIILTVEAKSPPKRILGLPTSLPTSLPPMKLENRGCPSTDPYFIKEYVGPMTAL